MRNKKLITSIMLGVSTIAGVAIINKAISYFAKADYCAELDNKINKFKWRLGEIYYTEQGFGKPLLLVHDLRSYSSMHEWAKVVDKLSKSYRVYTIDLLGCGFSEKPNMLYNSFLYVQLISEFVKNIIGKKCSILASNSSAPLAVQACKANPEIIDKLVLVSPEDVEIGMAKPQKRNAIYKEILCMPIIGTLIYNIAHTKRTISNILYKEMLYNRYSLYEGYAKLCYRNAHLGAYPKSLYACNVCNYTKINIKSSLSHMDSSIAVLYGAQDRDIELAAKGYQQLNPSVEIFKIDFARRLPHIDNPDEFIKLLEILL